MNKEKSKYSIQVRYFLYGFLLVLILAYMQVYYINGMPSQSFGLKHTKFWIEQNKKEWKKLQKQNPNLMNVRFGAYTGNHGCLMVLIEGELTDNDKLKLYEFIFNYNIPRRIKIVNAYKQNMKHQQIKIDNR